MEIVKNKDGKGLILCKKIVFRLSFMVCAFSLLQAAAVFNVAASEVRQGFTITGTVSDSEGSALPGVNVMVRGTSTGVITDANGRYSVIVPDQSAVLVFSFMGFSAQEIVVGNQRMIHVTLEEDAQQLKEVVVTALGIRREEKSLGYVTQKVAGEGLQTVKGTTVVTSLTGKVAGLQIMNTTEFMRNSVISIRGATPILVVDGVPAYHLNINDINQDDIESIDVLKGATASALYGSRGGNGAIIITTKRSEKDRKFNISINTSNMFHSGFLAIPEVQSSYAAGLNGVYNINNLDYVWGPKLDAGVEAEQWDPILKERRKFELKSIGKNNFKNFLEFGYISNTNVSVSQKSENGSVRSSASYLRFQHPYPNALSQQFGYTINGEMKLGKKVTVNGNLGFSKRWAPNYAGIGYNDQGYMYTILIWTGTEYDIRDYRDYWIIPHEKQNWLYSGWYDNPYLMAYEKTEALNNNKMNAMASLNYEITNWLKMVVRSGYEHYTDQTEKRSPWGINSTRYWGGASSVKGYYQMYDRTGFTTNNDLILMANGRIGKFGIDGLIGGSIFYRQANALMATSRGGLVIPGFYSLHNSAEAPSASQALERKGVNSVYGKFTVDYDSKIFVDVTGRNDWSSTLPTDDNSYFYPSVATSILPSEFVTLPDWFSFWKLRGSWTISKQDLSVYDTNNDFITNSNVWDGLNTAYYPYTIRGRVKPVTNRTFEVGTAMNFLKSRIKFDFTFYNKHTYNRTISTNVTEMSGFTTKLINIGEEFERKGFEITLEGKPVDTKDLKWTVQTNWATSRRYYKKLDPEYSEVNPWIKKGNRVDNMTFADFARDPSGNIIHLNGSVQTNPYNTHFGYYDPNWNWGLSNTVSWKRFIFNLSFDGRLGGLSWATTEYYMWDTGSHRDSDNTWRYQEVVEGKKNYCGGGVQVKDGTVKYKDNYGTVESDTRVFEPNTTEVSYQTYARRYYTRQPKYLFEETFFKLRELSVSYDIPQNVVHTLGMSSASISLIGQNLFLWSKEHRFTDPDVGANSDVPTNGLAAPSVRYAGFNLKLNF